MKNALLLLAGALIVNVALAAEPVQVQYTVPLNTTAITNTVPAASYGALAELTLVSLSNKTATVKHVKAHTGGTTERTLGTGLSNATTYWPADNGGATNAVLLLRGDKIITTLNGTNATPVQVILRIKRD